MVDLARIKPIVEAAKKTYLNDGEDIVVGAIWVDQGGGTIVLTLTEQIYIETVTPDVVMALINELEQWREKFGAA